jgi:hypothetical protein
VRRGQEESGNTALLLSSLAKLLTPFSNEILSNVSNRLSYFIRYSGSKFYE